MKFEEREDFVDLVAQAVIDRIEERDRINGLVDLVVQRVLDLQKQEQEANTPSSETDEEEEEAADVE